MPSLLQRAAAALRAFRAPRSTRAFQAAQASRLTADWFAGSTSADAEIRRDFRRLLDRSRDLERNNDYMRGFLLAAHRNINGSHRYDLRSDAGDFISPPRGGGPARWQSDTTANRLIEQAWADWCRPIHCTATRRHSWRRVRQLSVRAFFRDGNVLIRKLRGPAAGNPYGFRLQLWEIDHLDTDKFQERTRAGHEIRFGIETDADGAHLAYWVRARHPGDSFAAFGASLRVTADEFYHMALTDRAEQTIGLPAPISAITRLRQLGAFEEAAVVAARLGAANAVFFESTGESEWTGDSTSDGRAIMDIEPGTATQLPQGWKPHATEFGYPNIETGDFRKAMLRGVCASLGVSYTTLGNDLESVNFSSARIGLFDEREGWKDLQLCFSEDLWEPIFADWLESAITAGAIPLPLGKFAKFNRPVFKARRWAMIDPVKEIESARVGIALRTTSRRQFIEEQGGDVEEVFHDNLADEQLADDIGLDLQPPDPMPEALGEAQSDAEDPDAATPPKPPRKTAAPPPKP